MTNQEIVSNFFIECYQNHNYDYAMKYLSENYVDHSPANARGNKGAIGIMKCVEEQFCDMKIQIKDIFNQDGKVAVRVQYTGKHIGLCMNIPATNKTISFEALEIFYVENNQITESWGYWPDPEIIYKLQH